MSLAHLYYRYDQTFSRSSEKNLLESRFFIVAERQRAAHVYSEQSEPTHTLSSNGPLGSRLGNSFRLYCVTGRACHGATDILSAVLARLSAALEAALAAASRTKSDATSTPTVPTTFSIRSIVAA